MLEWRSTSDVKLAVRNEGGIPRKCHLPPFERRGKEQRERKEEGYFARVVKFGWFPLRWN